jgi:hypothetical protein
MPFNEYIRSLGDPTIIGWTITIAYFSAAFLCWRVVKIEESRDGRVARSYLLWFGLFILLVILGLNKQLDLQTLLRNAGRYIAEKDGWYGMRREIQNAFIGFIGLLGLLGFIGLLVLLKNNLKDFKLVVTGLVLLISFVLIRAASFNHVDYFLDKWRIVGPFRMKYVIELGGVVLIGIEAGKRLFKRVSGSQFTGHS